MAGLKIPATPDKATVKRPLIDTEDSEEEEEREIVKRKKKSKKSKSQFRQECYVYICKWFCCCEKERQITLKFCVVIPASQMYSFL